MRDSGRVSGGLYPGTMFCWKVWFAAPGLPQGLSRIETIQQHRYRNGAWNGERVLATGRWWLLTLLSGSIEYPGGTLGPGEILLVPPESGRPGPAAAGSAVEFLYLQFDGCGCEPTLRTLAAAGPVRIGGGDPRLLRILAWNQVWSRMVRANPARREATPVITVSPSSAWSLLNDSLSMLLPGAPAVTDPFVAKAMETMHNTRRLDLGITAWAELLDCTRQHLCARFRTAGLPSPARWLIERRIEEAERLLHTGMTLTEAARQVGYASASTFLRARRRIR